MRGHSYMVSASREETLTPQSFSSSHAQVQPRAMGVHACFSVDAFRAAVAVVHPDAIAHLRRTRAHHRRHRCLAARALRALERSSAPGTAVAGAATGARGQPVCVAAVAYRISRDGNATRPGGAGAAHASDEHRARTDLGDCVVVRGAAIVLRRSSQRRAGAVRFHAIADRAFLRRNHRRHRHSVHLPYRISTGALAAPSELATDRAHGAGAGWLASSEVLRASTGAAGTGLDAGAEA